ncbi:MAG: hypothetical protein GY805_27265 [Chloroflexi bacterium]|nr:hypothetical protein [Chloroflexota bacterium]
MFNDPDLITHINFEAGWTIIGILGFVFLHFAIEPFRWVVYLKKWDRGSLFTLLYIFSSTAFFSYVLPAKLGIPLRFWLIKRYQKLGAAVAGIYMVADSAMIMGSWAFASLMVGGDFAVEIVRQNLNRFAENRAVIGLLLAALALLSLGGLFIIRKRKKNIRESFETAWQTLSVWQLIATVFLFALDIASYVFRHGLIILLVGGPQIGWANIAAITVLSIFAGFVSAMPMGLVGYDATIIFLLTQQGVGVETAALVPIINRAANLLVSVALGVPSAFKLGIGVNVKELANRVKLSNYE